MESKKSEIVKDLVSILVPCYQAEKFIQRFLDSIIAQTYKDIELVIVNNGCTDNTENIIFENKNKLEARGIEFKYIFCKKNQGPAYALNLALKEFTGEYLSWLDCDDIIYADCIETKVNFMKAHPDCGFCLSQAELVNENDLDTITSIRKREKPIGNDYLFWDCLLLKNLVFGTVYSFAKTEAVLKAIPNREIVVGSGGQNMQMLLPLAYHFKCGYIEKPLGKYVEREESYIHSVKNWKKQIDDVYKLTLKTLDNMDMDSTYRYYAKVITYYRRIENFIKYTTILRKTKNFIKNVLIKKGPQ